MSKHKRKLIESLTAFDPEKDMPLPARLKTPEKPEKVSPEPLEPEFEASDSKLVSAPVFPLTKVDKYKAEPKQVSNIEIPLTKVEIYKRG